MIELPVRARVDDTPVAPRRSIFKRPVTYAIPAALFAGASMYFFLDARQAHARLDDIVASSSMHYFDEAESERRRWRGHTIVGFTGAGLALGFTVTTIVMATRGSSPPPATTSQLRVTPSLAPGLAGLQLHANF